MEEIDKYGHLSKIKVLNYLVLAILIKYGIIIMYKYYYAQLRGLDSEGAQRRKCTQKKHRDGKNTLILYCWMCFA